MPFCRRFHAVNDLFRTMTRCIVVLGKKIRLKSCFADDNMHFCNIVMYLSHWLLHRCCAECMQTTNTIALQPCCLTPWCWEGASRLGSGGSTRETRGRSPLPQAAAGQKIKIPNRSKIGFITLFSTVCSYLLTVLELPIPLVVPGPPIESAPPNMC